MVSPSGGDYALVVEEITSLRDFKGGKLVDAEREVINGVVGWFCGDCSAEHGSEQAAEMCCSPEEIEEEEE